MQISAFTKGVIAGAVIGSGIAAMSSMGNNKKHGLFSGRNGMFTKVGVIVDGIAHMMK